MKFECEYTIKIKLNDLYMVEGHSSDELRDEITKRGRENLKKYFNGVLFDPDKNVIFEDTNFKLKEV
jgi:hypothetical protein